MNRAVIGMGSNIDAARNVDAAITAIAQSHRLIAQSRLVQTKAIGPTPGADYLNGAVLIETALPREALIDSLKEIESQLGRHRTDDKYAPRTIDLDIVVWNDQVVDADVYERNFLREAVVEVLGRLP